MVDFDNNRYPDSSEMYTIPKICLELERLDPVDTGFQPIQTKGLV